MKKKICILFFCMIMGMGFSFGQSCSFNGVALNNNQTQVGYRYNFIEYNSSYTCSSRVDGYDIFQCQSGDMVGLSGGYFGDYPYLNCIDGSAKSCIFGERFGQQIVIPHFAGPLLNNSGELFGLASGENTNLLGTYVFPGYRKESVDSLTSCDMPSIGISGSSLVYNNNSNTTLLYCQNGIIFDFYEGLSQATSYYMIGGIGAFSPTGNIVNSSYKHSFCQNRTPRNCQLGNINIKNGESVNTFNTADSRETGCISEVRTCVDGVLSGSFSYLSCTNYNGYCGASNGLYFTDQPSINLCSAGTPSSLNYISATKKRTWSCEGNGGTDDFCEALWTGNTTKGICNDFPNGANNLSSTNPGLCKFGIAYGFQENTFNRRRNCTTAQGTSYNCEAKKSATPTARIVYSTTSPTNNSVTAYLLDIQPYGTVVQNNNGLSTRLFQTNGLYTFILKYDDNISYLTATVDRINTRPLTLADLSLDYQSKKCAKYKDNMVAKSNKYNMLDIQTMANLCLLPMKKRGNQLTINSKKNITRKELLEYSYHFAHTIRNYTPGGITQTDQYSYKNPPKTNGFKDIILRFSLIGGREHITHTNSRNTILVDRNKAATPKELYNTISHILFTHNDTISHWQSLWKSENREKKKTINYGEYAYLMRRLLEGYDRIPIGANDQIIYLLYEKIKNQTIEDQKSTIADLSLGLKKISPDTAERQGLSIRRMLDDMSAVYNNTIPKRKGVTSISLEEIQQKLKQKEVGTLFYRLNQTNTSDFLEMSY